MPPSPPAGEQRRVDTQVEQSGPAKDRSSTSSQAELLIDEAVPHPAACAPRCKQMHSQALELHDASSHPGHRRGAGAGGAAPNCGGHEANDRLSSIHLLLALLWQAGAAPGRRWLRRDCPLRLLGCRRILAAAATGSAACGPAAALANQVHAWVVPIVLLPAAQSGGVGDQRRLNLLGRPAEQ